MYRNLRWLLLFSSMIAITALVLGNVKSHAPVQDGSAAEFWMVVCDIDIDGSMKDFNYSGKIYPPRGPWAIYYISGYHDEFIRRVPLKDLAPQLPMIEKTFKSMASMGELRPWLSRVPAEWERKGSDEQEVRRLLALMRESHLANNEEDEKSYQYLLDCEKQFEVRWTRANRYWLTIVFEVVWLNGVVLFALLPILRNAGRFTWAIHLGLAIPLLFLPFFLGYCPYTFTSAFPAGGIYYPYTIYPFRELPLFDIDIWYLENAPQPLEPLTQEPGPWAAITGMGVAGPVAICTIGMAVSVCVLVFTTLWSAIARSFRAPAGEI